MWHKHRFKNIVERPCSRPNYLPAPVPVHPSGRRARLPLSPAPRCGNPSPSTPRTSWRLLRASTGRPPPSTLRCFSLCGCPAWCLLRMWHGSKQKSAYFCGFWEGNECEWLHLTEQYDWDGRVSFDLRDPFCGRILERHPVVDAVAQEETIGLRGI